MAEWDLATVKKYHRDTKHSPASVRAGTHYLDWRNKPKLFKHYLDGQIIPLPQDLPETGTLALEALAVREIRRRDQRLPTLDQIAYVLFYAAGVTKKLANPQGDFYFRAAACAGALYPVEVYLACGDELQDLSAGVYHFSPDNFALTRLRSGDFRAWLVAATGEATSVRHAPLVLIFSAITFRSAWKYRTRSYRHHFWDSGTILANALAAAEALGLPAEVVAGFVDEDVNALIGVQADIEKSICLLTLGWASAAQPAESGSVESLDLSVQPLAPDPRLYPDIEAVHRASQLETTAQVRSWRRDWSAETPSNVLEDSFPLERLEQAALPRRSIEQVIRRRGSSRKFARSAIDHSSFSAILRAAMTPFPADWLAPEGPLLNQIFLNAHAVDGLSPGSYVYRREQASLQLLQRGDFRSLSAFVCLEQPLAGDASAVLFFLADLQSVLAFYGNRGYRLAQLEAGILGGRIYLGAYACDLGASGITFYDDEVVHHFSPQAKDLQTIFAVTLGVPRSLGGSRGRIQHMDPGDPVKL
jgi:SagB-type dehydrogenase family enzyme